MRFMWMCFSCSRPSSPLIASRPVNPSCRRWQTHTRCWDYQRRRTGFLKNMAACSLKHLQRGVRGGSLGGLWRNRYACLTFSVFIRGLGWLLLPLAVDFWVWIELSVFFSLPQRSESSWRQRLWEIWIRLFLGRRQGDRGSWMTAALHWYGISTSLVYFWVRHLIYQFRQRTAKVNRF